MAMLARLAERTITLIMAILLGPPLVLLIVVLGRWEDWRARRSLGPYPTRCDTTSGDSSDGPATS